MSCSSGPSLSCRGDVSSRPGFVVPCPSRHPCGSWLSVSWARRLAAKPQPTRGLGSLRERCRGGEEQARTVQSTDKMGMGCASWGPMALGALPLCIWGPGLPQNGASFLWGRAEPGVGGEPQTGMGTCSASEMLADHRFCQRSSRPGLWGDVSQPQGRFWTRISLYPWPRSAGGGCMGEGKDGERGGDDERGQSSDWSRELEAP